MDEKAYSWIRESRKISTQQIIIAFNLMVLKFNGLLTIKFIFRFNLIVNKCLMSIKLGIMSIGE